jgi:hypothetical protein
MHQELSKRWGSTRTLLRLGEERVRRSLVAHTWMFWALRSLVLLVFGGAFWLLFGLAGLLGAIAIVCFLLLGWPGRWLAMPAAILLPALGVIPYIWDDAAADLLALVLFFAFFAAATIEVISRRQTVEESQELPKVTGSDNVYRTTIMRVASARSDYLIPAAIAAVAAQSWFEPGTLIAFGDIFPLIDPSNLLAKSLPTWSTLADGLGSRSIGIVVAPVSAFASALHSVGLSEAVIERVFLTGLFVGEALAISFLIATVWPHARLIARLAGALFYLFNLLAFFNLPGAVQMLAFSLLPLLAALMIRGLQSRQRKYPILWALISIGLSYVAANPPLALVTAAGSILLAIAVHLSRNGDLRAIVAFSARAFSLSVLLNVWWIVPVLLSVGGSTGIASIPTSPEEWGWTQARNSITNLLSLNASWGWPQPLYFPYASTYQNPILGVITYAPAAIGLGALAFHTRRGRLVPLLAVTSLILIFLSKGVHEPFEEVNAWITQHVPGFWIIREPASKLLPLVVVLLTLLIVSSINNAVDLVKQGRYSERFKWIDPASGVVLVGLMLPLAAWPVITGHIVADERPTLPPVHISVPDHWEAAAELLNSTGGAGSGAVLVLPLSDYYQMPYEWGFYGTDAIPSHLIRHPVVQGISLGYIPTLPVANDLILRLESAIRRGDAGEGERLMKTLGVRYVLVRGDLDLKLAKSLNRSLVDEQVYNGRLSESSLVSRIASFGPLTLYESTSSNAGPVTTWGAARGSSEVAVGASRFSSDEVATLESSSSWPSSLGGEDPGPEVKLREASEARYVAEIEGMDGPFLLTLNQNFDDGWHASVSGNKQSLPHTRVNGFANGWLIREAGSIEVVIEYGPETWALLARVVSMAGLIGLSAVMLGPLLLKKLDKRRRNREAP